MGLALIILGFIILAYAIFLLSRAGNIEGGGIILLGPIPIIFGSRGFLRYMWIIFVILILIFIILTLYPLIYVEIPQ